MENVHSQKPRPIIKWVGGKRQLLAQITQMMPEHFGRYHEPFFGGGALFFQLTPENATVNDCNRQLASMYLAIKTNPVGVYNELRKLQDQYNNTETITQKDKLYYALRQSYNDHLSSDSDFSKPDFAALFIFLNKAGYNGLYRVNSEGLYNVPSAHRKTLNICDRNNIMAMSEALKDTHILCGDFTHACMDAKPSDFVFFDPPYYHTFAKYQKDGFAEADQVRLHSLFVKLSDNGVYCMTTNNDCEFIRSLYKDYHIKSADVRRSVNCDGQNRTGKEIIITNYM